MNGIAEVLWSGSNSAGTATGPLGGDLMVPGVSPGMVEMERMIRDIGPTDIPILLVGESGTGKEMLARSIFFQSQRIEKDFVKVVCGQLSRSPGNGDAADFEWESVIDGAGTMLLDGIDELSPDLQTGLVQLLDRNYTLNGYGERAGKTRRRYISTSSQELQEEVSRHSFRSDLYYRLSGICLRVPPLRERKGDLEPLAHYFFRRYSALFGRGNGNLLTKSVLKALESYSWPGNVRELENVIRSLVVLGDEEKALAALSGSIVIEIEEPFGNGKGSGKEKGEPLSLKMAARSAARSVEREMILKTLAETRWNRKQAAERLQISYKALLYKLKELDLEGKAPGANGKPSGGGKR